MSGRWRLACYQRWKALAGALVATGTIIWTLAVGVIWAADQRYQKTADVQQIQQDVRFLTTMILEERIVDLEVRIEIMESRSELNANERRELIKLRRKLARLKEKLAENADNGGAQ